MAEKKITVVIDGQEFVSKAADSAGGAMDGFAGKIPGWGKAIALATAAFAILSKAVGAVGDYVMESLASFDAYAASQTKLSAQSKLTGVSLDELKRIAKTAREEFGLGATVANEAAATVAKYASRAGDATRANDLLSAALDLGAAAGLSAADSMMALEQGLRGQDEGFDKLLGKNPSGIWKDYADANGLAVGKMTDTQKRMAELTAVVDAAALVQGTYAERLDQGAGQTEKLNNSIDRQKVAFGEAIQPLRIFVLQGLQVAVEWLGRTALAVARVVNAIGVAWVGGFKLATSAVGALAEGVGKLTGNKALEEWGAKQRQAFPEFVAQLNKMEKGIEATGDASTVAGTKLKAGTKVTEDEIKKQDAAWKQYLKDYEAGLKRINDAYDAYLKLLPRLKPALDASMDTTRVEGLNRALRESKDTADAAFKAMKDGAEPLPPLIKKAGDSVQDMGGKLETAADAVLTVGENFGGLDDDAKKVLGSVKDIGASMGDLAKNGLSFAGAAGLIGGVAGIVTGMMASDAERRRLLRDNNVQLERLKNEIGNLDLNVTGADLAGAQKALEAAGTDLYNTLRLPQGTQKIWDSLQRSGMTFGDLSRIAEELGMSIKNKDGSINYAALPQLLEALKRTEPGKFGQSFGDQLGATQSGFGVNQTGDLGQIGALGSLGGRFSSALSGIVDVNDLAGSRSRLAGLFERLNNGGLSAAELGGLTGTQFLDLVTDLIGRIDRLTPGGGGGGGASAGGDGTGGGGTVTTSGGVAVPTKTLSDVLDGVNAQTTALGAIHTKHLDIATEHLNEAKVQTGLLMSLVENTAPLREGITAIADKGLEAERLALAAERGLGASY